MFGACSGLQISALARWGLLCTLIVLAFHSANSLEQEPTSPPINSAKRVLILYSFDSEEGIYAGFDRVLHSQVRMRVRGRVEFYTEYLDLVRFPRPEHAQDMVKLLRLKYSGHKPDLIIPVSYSAITFLTGEGKDLFPGTPLVALFNVRRLNDLKSQLARTPGLSFTGVASADDPAHTLDLALRLQPDTEHVAVVVGSSPLERYWLNELKQDLSPYAAKVEITYLTGQPMGELLRQIAGLPSHTVVLSTFFFQDTTGQFFMPEEVLDLIARDAHVPVYGIYSNYIGHGVVGGRMTNSETTGRKLVDLAVAVLDGESASRIPIVMDDSARDTVDWRQLQHWGISEKRVPPSTLELFREPSAWERYRSLILVMISLVVVESLLILALVVNVQRRRRAEKAVLREKTLADAVIESLPGLFVLHDEAGNLLRLNKNAEVSARHKPGEVPLLGNIAEQDRQAALQARREVFERGSAQLEAEFLIEGGKTAPFYFTGVRVELEGKPYLAAIGINLTEQKKAEEALRRSDAQLRSFVAHAPYGIGTISVQQDRFLHANPALVKLLGYKSEAEVLALVVSRDLYWGSDSRGLWTQPTRADFFSAVEFEWKRKDGKLVNVRASGRRIPREQDPGDLIEIIAEDVTSRRLLEEQLRHAQKMEALGLLAGSVAHDFNNLLSVIIGYTELLSANPNTNAPMNANLETIKKAAERAASLTAQLLAFSRRQVLEPKVLNLNSLVTETQKMLQRLVGENIEQKIVLGSGLWKTKADPGQVVQVIMNLAINARDAMKKGGTLTIETSNVTFSEVTSFYSVDVAAGNYVLLSVTDTGTGIDAMTLTRIFEPFFTTKEPGKGTGLGLATVYGIVKQSGGYVFADSEMGGGTTFRIYLPQVEQVDEAPSISVAADAPQGAETLLVVEDEHAFRHLLRDGLQARGYHVLIAANGAEALRVAEQHAGAIRLLVTDVIMPQMSGPELARSLRQTRSDTDVLYMSGYTDDKLSDISASGELRLIQKPFRIDDLVQTIQEILDGRATRGRRSVSVLSQQ